jgi:hypothetical protein
VNSPRSDAPPSGSSTASLCSPSLRSNTREVREVREVHPCRKWSLSLTFSHRPGRDAPLAGGLTVASIGRGSVEAAVVVADVIDVATQCSAAVVVGLAGFRRVNAGVPAGAIDASLAICAVVADAAVVALEVPMREVVPNGGATDLDPDERLRVGGGSVTDANLVVRRPGPAATQGRDQTPGEDGQDPTTGSRGGQSARQPIKSVAVHRVSLPRRVCAERFGHVVELGHLSGSL